ncbi:MAG: hypothetical protein H0X66_14345 [Verrucomicrobia bacterium]|nr:hypothetical protein [Verrucomicrobiota bacterium]
MRRVFFIFGAITLSVTHAFSQVSNITTVTWEKVPPAVQQSIQMQAGDAAVQQVQRGIQNGEPVYSVPLPQDGSTRLVLDANGSILPTEPPASAQPVVAPVPEVPEPTNALPEGVTMEVVGGRRIYNIAGEGSQIQVTTGARVLSATDSFGSQMEKIPWQALPPVVQNAVRTQAGPGQILDITRGTFYGQSVYEVIYAQNTQRSRLRLSESGAVLGQATISIEDSSSVAVEPFIGAQHIPVAVITTLRAAAGTQPIESVQQEVIDGRITYIGVFRENGQPVTLRISQTGQILNR